MDTRNLKVQLKAWAMTYGFMKPRNPADKNLALYVIGRLSGRISSDFNFFIVINTKAEYQSLADSFELPSSYEFIDASRFKSLTDLVFNEDQKPFHLVMYKNMALSGWRIDNTKTARSRVILMFVTRPTPLELAQVVHRFKNQDQVTTIMMADDDLIEFHEREGEFSSSEFVPWVTVVNECTRNLS